MNSILRIVVLIGIFLSMEVVYSQGPSVNLEIGYNSGFSGKLGVGFTSIDLSGEYGNSIEDFGAGVNVQYGYRNIEGTSFHGPSLQAYFYWFLFKGGLNGNYLFKNGDSKFFLEPEIGVTFLSIASVTFTYNFIDDPFFPESYKPWGVYLSVNVPL